MRKLRLFGGASVAVLVLCAGVAASASAAPEWLRDGNVIAAAVPVTFTTGTGMVLFEDTKGGAFGEAVDIECPFSGKGAIGPGAAGKITEITMVAANCKASASCGAEKPAEAAALNLPWKTEVILLEPGGVNLYLMDFLEEGAGAPGWLFKCLNRDDTCTNGSATEPAFVELANEVVGGVNVEDAAFHSNSSTSFFNCSLGGAKNGLNDGLFTIKDEAGKNITVSG